MAVDQEIVTPGQGNVQVPSPSYQELKSLGNQLEYKERQLRIQQGTISKLAAQVEERKRFGKNYAAQESRLNSLRSQQAADLQDYQSYRDSLAGNESAARAAAPKAYRTGAMGFPGPKAPPVNSIYAQERNPQRGQTGIKYSQQGSLTGGGTVTSTGKAPTDSFESQRYQPVGGQGLRPGVYQPTQGTLRGQQVIITQGKPQTAGQTVRQLQGGTFEPGRLQGRTDQIVGVVRDKRIDLGPQTLIVSDEQGKTLYTTNVLSPNELGRGTRTGNGQVPRSSTTDLVGIPSVPTNKNRYSYFNAEITPKISYTEASVTRGMQVFERGLISFATSAAERIEVQRQKDIARYGDYGIDFQTPLAKAGFVYGPSIVAGLSKDVRERPADYAIGLAVGAGAGAVIGTSLVIGTKIASLTKTSPSIIRVIGSGTQKATKILPVAAGTIVAGGDLITVAGQPTDLARGQAIGTLLPEYAGAGVGASKVLPIAQTGTTRTVDALTAKYREYQFNKKYAGQIITDPMSKDLARTDRSLSVSLEVKPIKADVGLIETTQRQGLRTVETARARIYDEPVTITSQELAQPQDTFLATTGRRRTSQGTLRQEKNLLTSDIEGTGGLSGSTTTITELLPLQRRVTTAQEITARQPAEGVSTIELGASRARGGQEVFTQEVFITRYDPIALSGERSIVSTKQKPSSVRTAKQLIAEQKLLDDTTVTKGELENVVRFTREPGPTRPITEVPLAEGGSVSLPENIKLFQRGRAQLLINQETGQFKIKEFTEFRKFLYGTQGIPGRPVVSTGTIDKALTQPLEVVKIKVTPTKTTRPTTPQQPEYFTPSGVLLLEPQETTKETSTVQETIQEPITVQQQATRQEQPFTEQQGTTQQRDVLQDTSLRSALRTRVQLVPVQGQGRISRFSFTPTTRQDTAQIVDTGTAQERIPRTRLERITLIGTTTATTQKVETTPEQITKTSLIPITVTPQRITQGTPFLATPHTKEPTRVVPPVRLGGSSTPSKKRGFRTIVLRGGKEFVVSSKPLGLREAALLGQKVNVETLRASFKVVPFSGGDLTSEEYKAVQYSLPGQVFAPSKSRAGFFVQQRGYRLGSTGERTEIQQAKKYNPYTINNKKKTAMFG